MFDFDHEVFDGNFIYTFTGRKIYAIPPNKELDAGPSLKDIAVQCGRITRFAGATTIWWSTLHHLFVCDRLVVKLYGNLDKNDFTLARIGALLHDGHECITSDIPGPFKPKVISFLQNDIDRRIFEEFGLPLELSIEVKEAVRTVDELALHAEGRIVGPPKSDEWALEQSPEVIEAVRDIIHRYPNPLDTIRPQGKAVTEYQQLVIKLLNKLKGSE